MRAVYGRHAQRGNDILLLLSNAEPDPAGDQRLESRACAQQAGHRLTGSQNQLKVVQQQQELPVLKHPLQQIEHRTILGHFEVKRLGNSKQDQGGIIERSQVDEEDAVGKALMYAVCHLQAQEGFANASGRGGSSCPISFVRYN